MNSMSFAPMVKFDQTRDSAFPDVDPEHEPFGSRVLVQMRLPKGRTDGGLELADETKDTIKWNNQVGKVVKIGPLAFRNRTTLEPWPEGAWFEVDDFVRTPKFGGDKFEVRDPETGSVILFGIFNDLDFIAKVTGDPLSVIAFV